MARLASQDFLQNFRFYVSAFAGVDGLSEKGLPGSSFKEQAGFQSCSMPDMSVEPTEYREGIMKYTRKFPGIPTVSDCSLMRGIVAQETTFFKWMVQTVSGGEYRSNIRIDQYSRTDMAQGAGTFGSPTTPGPYNGEQFPTAVSRTTFCYECMPMRVKPGADLDATSGEVSMKEMDFAMEYFEVAGSTPLDPTVAPGSPAPLDDATGTPPPGETPP